MIRRLAKILLPGSWLAAVRTAKRLAHRLTVLEQHAEIQAAAIALARHPDLRTQAQAVADGFLRHELKVLSQNGEDGLLLHLLETVGAATRTCVEFGIGDGRECNTALLSLYFGWSGLLMDGDPQRLAVARRFYAERLQADAQRVTIVEATVRTDNINALLRDHAVPAEVDLLSIDIDGNDYWVWQAIDTVQPRVVVIEYNAVFGPTRACTIPYDPNFSRWRTHPSGLYFGASLTALAQLAAEKGYRLVGCDSHGVNAFFVRDNLAPEALPGRAPEACYRPLRDRLQGLVTESRFGEIEHLPLAQI